MASEERADALAAIVLSFVVFLYSMWLNASSQLFSAICPSDAAQGLRVLRYAAGLAASGVFLVFRKRLADIGVADLVLGACALAAYLAAVLALMADAAFQAPMAATLAFSLLCGFLDGWLAFRTGYANIRCLGLRASMRQVLVYAFGYLFSNVLIGGQANAYLLLLMAAYPLLALRCIRAVRRLCPAIDAHLGDPEARYGYLFFLPVIASMTSVIVYANGVSGLWGARPGGLSAQLQPVHLLVIAATMALSYGAMALSLRGEKAANAIPCVLLALALLALFSGGGGSSSAALALDCFLEVAIFCMVTWSSRLFYYYWHGSLYTAMALQLAALRLVTTLHVALGAALESAAVIALTIALLVGYIAYILVKTPESARADTRVEDAADYRVRRFEELAGQHGLTKREQEVCRLLLEGRNVPYIQDRLFISEGTVRTHITHLYRKLGVGSRQELIDLFQG